MIKYGEQDISSVKLGEDTITLVKLGEDVVFGGYTVNFNWISSGTSYESLIHDFTIHYTDGTSEGYYENVAGGYTTSQTFSNVLYIEIRRFEYSQSSLQIITDDVQCKANSGGSEITGTFADLMANRLSYSYDQPAIVWLLSDGNVSIETES